MSIEMVSPKKIKPGTINPRQELGDLSRLAWSFKRRSVRGLRGVIVPLLVRKIDDEEFDYEIIDGKRRREAALMAELPEVPIVEEDENVDPKELEWEAYHANKNSKEFTWIENAMFYQSQHEKGMTLDQIGYEARLTKQSISYHIRALKLVEKSTQVDLLEFTTAREIAEKCLEKDMPELVELVIDNKLSRRETNKILFAYRNFLASLDVLKEFNELLFAELRSKYYPYRFYPRIIKLYYLERDLRTGEAKIVDRYLDIDDYPTKESAEKYASEHHGQVVARITKDGWQVAIIPYTQNEIDEKLKKLVEEI